MRQKTQDNVVQRNRLMLDSSIALGPAIDVHDSSEPVSEPIVTTPNFQILVVLHYLLGA